MHKKAYCYECEKEQTFYYFMMMPVGYWVCDVCGTAEGCVKCKVKEVFFKDVPSFELLIEMFKVITLAGEIRASDVKSFHLPESMGHLRQKDTVYFHKARNFEELRELLKITFVSVGGVPLGDKNTFEEVIKAFGETSVLIDDDNPAELSEELNALCKEVDSQKAITVVHQLSVDK